MGRPWPGMWASDIAAVTEALASEPMGARVGVFGVGQFARSALFASALCPRIAASAVRLEVPGYRDDLPAAEFPTCLAYWQSPKCQ